VLRRGQFFADSPLPGLVNAQTSTATIKSPNSIKTNPPPPRPPNRIKAIPSSANAFANVVIAKSLRGPGFLSNRRNGDDTDL